MEKNLATLGRFPYNKAIVDLPCPTFLLQVLIVRKGYVCVCMYPCMNEGKKGGEILV